MPNDICMAASSPRKRNRHNNELIVALAGVMLPTLFIIIIGLGYGMVYKSAPSFEGQKVYIAKDCDTRVMRP